MMEPTSENIEGHHGELVQRAVCQACYQGILSLGLTAGYIATATAVAMISGVDKAVSAAEWPGDDADKFRLLLRGAIRHVMIRDAVLLN